MLCTNLKCPLAYNGKIKSCPYTVCQYRTKPNASINLTPNAANVSKENNTRNLLLSLICEQNQKAHICDKENCTSYNNCIYCAPFADAILSNGFKLQKWTSASTPPKEWIPVLVEYIAFGTTDDLCNGIACITDNGNWVWWDGSKKGSKGNDCHVEIVRWMDFPISHKASYKITWLETCVDEESETKTHYFCADKSLLKDSLPDIHIPADCCLISIELSANTDTLNLPVCIAPAKFCNSVPIAQDWYDADIDKADIEKILAFIPKDTKE